jgi:hypothetical protein
MKFPDEFPDEALDDPAAVRKHLDAMEAQNKIHWAATMPQLIEDTATLVTQSRDPEVMLKFAKFLTDYIGWGTAAKKVEGPQDKLPVFNFVLNGGSMRVSKVDPDTDEELEVFDLSAARPTPLMLQSIGVNEELGVLDV